jgi:ribosomal-protein-alanine N-acetyltransferase
MNYQLGIFDHGTSLLCGCAGLRIVKPGTAIGGIELTPAHWGRYRLAIDVAAAVVEFGFSALRLAEILGSSTSGNSG